MRLSKACRLRVAGLFSGEVCDRITAYMMIKRRAAAAGIETKIGNHSFRRPELLLI
jgi:hypothetical protein